MPQRTKEKVVNEIIQILSQNNISYGEVPAVLKSVESELRELCSQQVIKIV